MNTTANYHLPQWEATDHITRADLNSAMSAIDTALSGAAQIVTGTYAGNGQEERTISLGFTPKAVIVYSNAGAQNTGGSGIYYKPSITVTITEAGVEKLESAESVTVTFKKGTTELGTLEVAMPGEE